MVTLRLALYPVLAMFGLCAGVLLAILYVAFFLPFLAFQALAFCLAAISNDKGWRDEGLDDAVETVRDCSHAVFALLLAPISVAIWCFAPLSATDETKLYWL